MTLWYLARAAGVVALVAFTASTVLGALSPGRNRSLKSADIDRRYLVQMAHRSAAITGLVALAAHVVLLVMDSYVNVSIGGALIPYTAGYRPLALALGTIAVYLFTLVAVSGAARGRLATSVRAARAWRSIHVMAYLGWVAAMAHGVLAGTDTGARWTTAVYLACGGAVAVAVAVRLRSRARSAADPLTRARTLERSRS
ncbi:ferric reductase [Aeromicrobium sp. 9AM]|uniref:ferric reductase n=1 Tax=Aeromicrobium sp. 9AM TaxID=2653126 RepID=UPI0012F05490|nr:ferric reductase [Aeromicrobium sp. 9AM]VXC12842.1 conserved membrane hypothetical protein [Aeromicrobium sp. 9AM]